MAKAIVTIKLMPETPDANLDEISTQAEKIIVDYSQSVEVKKDVQPVAFGLKSISLTFIMDEEKGGTDALEEQLQAIEEVNSVEVTDVRRALG